MRDGERIAHSTKLLAGVSSGVVVVGDIDVATVSADEDVVASGAYDGVEPVVVGLEGLLGVQGELVAAVVAKEGAFAFATLGHDVTPVVVCSCKDRAWRQG